MPRRPKTGPLPNALPRPIVTPAWARPVATRHPRFGDLLACALVEWHLVAHGLEGRVFRELARKAKQEWARRGKTSDEALQVAYELLRLAPGISECVDRPEYAWLREPKAAIEASRGSDDWSRALPCEFERRVRKTAGAPRQVEHLGAMFEMLRAAGHSYEETVREIAAVRRRKPDLGARDAKEAARIFGSQLAEVTDADVRSMKRALRPSRTHRSRSR